MITKAVAPSCCSGRCITNATPAGLQSSTRQHRRFSVSAAVRSPNEQSSDPLSTRHGSEPDTAHKKSSSSSAQHSPTPPPNRSVSSSNTESLNSADASGSSTKQRLPPSRKSSFPVTLIAALALAPFTSSKKRQADNTKNTIGSNGEAKGTVALSQPSAAVGTTPSAEQQFAASDTPAMVPPAVTAAAAAEAASPSTLTATTAAPSNVSAYVEHRSEPPAQQAAAAVAALSASSPPTAQEQFAATQQPAEAPPAVTAAAAAERNAAVNDNATAPPAAAPSEQPYAAPVAQKAAAPAAVDPQLPPTAEEAFAASETPASAPPAITAAAAEAVAAVAGDSNARHPKASASQQTMKAGNDVTAGAATSPDSTTLAPSQAVEGLVPPEISSLPAELDALPAAEAAAAMAAAAAASAVADAPLGPLESSWSTSSADEESEQAAKQRVLELLTHPAQFEEEVLDSARGVQGVTVSPDYIEALVEVATEPSIGMATHSSPAMSQEASPLGLRNPEAGSSSSSIVTAMGTPPAAGEPTQAANAVAYPRPTAAAGNGVGDVSQNRAYNSPGGSSSRVVYSRSLSRSGSHKDDAKQADSAQQQQHPGAGTYFERQQQEQAQDHPGVNTFFTKPVTAGAAAEDIVKAATGVPAAAAAGTAVAPAAEQHEGSAGTATGSAAASRRQQGWWSWWGGNRSEDQEEF